MLESNFPERLKKRLEMELPGSVAHNEMKARQLNGGVIDFKKRPDLRHGGVLILFYYDQDHWKFPVIRRAEYDGVHGGQIALPGGKKEEEDIDLIATATRETEEEIGVNRSDIQIVGQLSSFFVGASNYEVLPVVGMIDHKPNFLPDPMEVAEVIEVRMMDFLDGSKRKEKEIMVRDFPLIAPYFDIENQFIWGATAMMLSELTAIVKDIYE